MNNIVDGKLKPKEIIEKMNGESLDIVKENVLKLKEIFPEVFCEDKIDFKKLEEVLGEYTDDSDERYRFEWHGKSKAIKIAQTPSRGTLRPCKEESKNWDSTENLYIEGDNLEVLKLLQKSYQGKVKMIYIDPPYNTGNDFIYPDDYSDNIENYLRITGQKDDDGNKISSNSEDGGRYHTNWLNMVYPRLRLAKNLLMDDGVIFISIDDNEIDNLKKIFNGIMGENNFLACIIWERAFAPINTKKHFSESHDYVLVYAKNKEQLICNGIPRSEETDSRYLNPDNDSRGPWTSGDLSVGPIVENKVYEIITPSGRKVLPPSGYCWRLTRERFEEFVQDNRIWFGEKGDNVPRIKRFKAEVKNGITPMTIWKYTDVGHSQEAKQKLKDLFDGKAFFDYPKPVELIKRMLQIYSYSDSCVLDFFSGSSTTAHAVMQLNAEDKGNRKFIMVQLPEECDEKSEAFKAGYKNICEIGKERIRRAGDKIVEENKDKEGIEDLDIGFKVFKLDTSNIKPWNPDYDNIEMTLEDSIDNFVPDRTQEDIVYEIMLKYGIDLTYPVKIREADGKKIFSIGFGALLVCLDDDITLEAVNEIVKLKEELNPETCRVVFKDNGFKTDSVKTNAVEILKRNDVKDIMSI
ncbi:site-specific DNA-methyltransferase [Clostridium butyricum]|uniref:Site-specific DNA-methyltransferase n=1 Tax=Clostridium butyricum TaxID=1492 RepID=A0A6L9EQE6_CLOBU|nr:site-specific DNA-methyltransferase [Clostridium butyricum]